MRTIDPKLYREEAERLRTKAFHFNADDPLRRSYLQLAGEYARLAEVLEKGQQTKQP